jgi:hypothetical protein
MPRHFKKMMFTPYFVMEHRDEMKKERKEKISLFLKIKKIFKKQLT